MGRLSKDETSGAATKAVDSRRSARSRAGMAPFDERCAPFGARLRFSMRIWGSSVEFWRSSMFKFGALRWDFRTLAWPTYVRSSWCVC
jgi:hypothetical protein